MKTQFDKFLEQFAGNLALELVTGKADPAVSPLFRDNRCGYCDDGRKPCRQGVHNRCSNPTARNH